MYLGREDSFIYFNAYFFIDKEVNLLRALVLSRLRKCEHQPTIEIALQKFNDYAQNGIQIDSDLRSVVFTCAASRNDPHNVSALKKILATSNFGEIEKHCIMSLGTVSDVELLEEVYKHCITDAKIRPQDIMV